MTLTQAIRTGRLAEFIAQEEKRGIGAVDRAELDRVIHILATIPIKPTRSTDRTSRFPSAGGLTGKRTR
jgi:hypothetical protein